jgi:hypothetical protein
MGLTTTFLETPFRFFFQEPLHKSFNLVSSRNLFTVFFRRPAPPRLLWLQEFLSGASSSFAVKLWGVLPLSWGRLMAFLDHHPTVF